MLQFFNFHVSSDQNCWSTTTIRNVTGPWGGHSYYGIKVKEALLPRMLQSIFLVVMRGWTGKRIFLKSVREAVKNVHWAISRWGLCSSSSAPPSWPVALERHKGVTGTCCSDRVTCGFCFSTHWSLGTHLVMMWSLQENSLVQTFILLRMEMMVTPKFLILSFIPSFFLCILQ